MVEEGTAAPNFKLVCAGGTSVELKALKGQPVVIYFYPKDDTSGCTAQAIQFTELADQFAEIGTPVIGISPDPVASKEKFQAKHGLNVTLAADPEKSVVQNYGVWVEKSMYGRKYMGVERTTFLIDAKGKVARVWRKVKVPGHGEDVLEAAKELAT